MTEGTRERGTVSRREVLKAGGVGVGALSLAGCTAADDPQDLPALAGTAPVLDLETLQTETPAGTVAAERIWAENTYVGAVDENLYIAVSFPESPDTAQEATVYLCDGEMAEHLTGEVGAGTTTFEGDVLEVEFSMAEGGVSGVVNQDGEAPWPFTATEATGDAGLYTAEFTYEGEEYHPYWVVLPDGTQRGKACWMCCAVECLLCCCAPGSCLHQN